jgi:heme/copper-type cytochrome/quinol oxidase subunit 1
MMSLDVLLGTSFFMPAIMTMGNEADHVGGNPLLFQHLFWFFGHPEVYIVALPAFGIVSDLISIHARKNIFGYRMMVWAIIIIGALSFVVWAHHMYVSGMNPYFGFFFATTTLIIAVPTALKVYNWVLTLWQGNIHLTVVCRCSLSYGHGSGTCDGGVWCDLSLVPQDHGALVPRGYGEIPFLGHFCGILPSVFADALPRYYGRATPLFRNHRYFFPARLSANG